MKSRTIVDGHTFHVHLCLKQATFLIPTGPFIVGYLASRIGRKWTMLASSLPLFIGWVLLAAAKDVALLYAGRVFCGVTMGMGFTIVPLYCAEIASVRFLQLLYSKMNPLSSYFLFYLFFHFRNILILYLCQISRTAD